MMVMYSFNVQTASGVEKSPILGASDMTQLKNLFPDNSVWQGRTGGVGNMLYINLEQAKALYDAMIKHYVENDVSDEQYQTGNFTGSIVVVSDLQSTFEELIEFFEKIFGREAVTT